MIDNIFNFDLLSTSLLLYLVGLPAQIFTLIKSRNRRHFIMTTPNELQISSSSTHGSFTDQPKINSDAFSHSHQYRINGLAFPMISKWRFESPCQNAETMIPKSVKQLQLYLRPLRLLPTRPRPVKNQTSRNQAHGRTTERNGDVSWLSFRRELGIHSSYI